MPYLGSAPATSFLSMTSQSFTGGSGTSFTLNKSVSTPSDIAVFVNNVRQSPVNSSYSVSGTTLTMSASIASSDNFYVVFLGSAVGTINPASGSVGISQLSATGTKDATTFLRGDNSFATVSTTPNSPAFFAYLSANQTLTNNARNKLLCNTETFDSGGQYDNSSNYRFTPTTAGKYYVFANSEYASEGQGTVNWILNEIFKNGTSSSIRVYGYIDFRNNPANSGNPIAVGVFDMNGSSDYIEFYSYPGLSSGTPTAFGNATTPHTYFGAFKLGV